MKIVHMAFFMIAAFAFTSCSKELTGSGNVVTENRQTAGFTGIENNGDFKIVVNKDATTNLSLSGEDNVLDEVVTEVENNKLKVRYRDYNYRHHHKQVVVTLSTPELNFLSLSGSGSIESAANWAGADLSVNISGSGKIDVATTTSSTLKTNVSGSGDLVLHGGAEKSDFTISGSGKIMAYDVISKEAIMSISGSGSARITVSGKLNAHISGSGTVYYKGNPQTVNTSVSGSGKVIKQ